MENPEDLYNELDLKLMNVKQLGTLLKDNGLKVPRLKADMVQSLLNNSLQKNGRIRGIISSSMIQPSVISSSMIQPSVISPLSYFSEEELLKSLSGMSLKIPRTEENERRIANLIQSFSQELSSMSEPEVSQFIQSLGIEDLPPEMIRHICNQMDPPTLGRFIQSSKKLGSACTDIYTNLKDKRSTDEASLMLQNLIRFQNQFWYLDKDGDKDFHVKYFTIDPRSLRKPPVDLERFELSQDNYFDVFPDFPFKPKEIHSLPLKDYPKFYQYVKNHKFKYENSYSDIIDSLKESIERNSPQILHRELSPMLAYTIHLQQLGTHEKLERLVELLTQLNQAILQNNLITARQLINTIENIPL